MKYLIAGLGNPGAEYANTRHNIGFIILDALAKSLGVTFTSDRYASVARARYKSFHEPVWQSGQVLAVKGKGPAREPAGGGG
jgi:peptidyl-tRNA hydrolase